MRLFSETSGVRRSLASGAAMKTNRMALGTVAGLAALTLGLAGCGGSDSGSGSDEDQNSPAASESAPAGSAEDDDQSAATDDDKDDQDDDKTTSAQGSSGQGLSADADLAEDSPAISAEDAIKKAKDKVGGGTVHGIELDWDDKDQAWQYDVSILDGKTDHDVDIDAETGKVVSEDKDDADDKEQAIDLNDPMTFEDALKRAQKKSDGKLVSWKLEFDDDKQEYQFDFEKDGEDTEVTVDTESKRVSVDD
ncbi:PepSY domain containing protein [Brevibacterium linens]|uniref:PepSY domain containing protein n=1 Tax=Brevibacterium linens TaxID=1703 RepID=A0A0B9AQU5_BRELN|nr:PepSY domain containing protein [Brevibacterium linens]